MYEQNKSIFLFFGITISICSIWWGIKYEPQNFLSSVINTNILTKEIKGNGNIKEKICLEQDLTYFLTELKITLEDRKLDLNDLKVKVVGLVIDEKNKIDQENFREIRNELKERKAIYQKIEERINDINEYVVFQKKIIMANIFFTHIIKLIFIFSGIVGLFWLLIMVSKEKTDNHGKEQ